MCQLCSFLSLSLLQGLGSLLTEHSYLLGLSLSLSRSQFVLSVNRLQSRALWLVPKRQSPVIVFVSGFPFILSLSLSQAKLLFYFFLAPFHFHNFFCGTLFEQRMSVL